MSKKDPLQILDRLREIVQRQPRFAPQPAGAGPERSQEIRLGLVMYGGVSLAIYIFGVAQEFFRAVRGRGVYRLLKDLTDADIVVDVMSGTSAGGVNGILLGYALANEREFSDCNRLWRDAGDLMRLIHAPGTPQQAVKSVLDSDFYLKRMRQGLKGMSPITAADKHASRVHELDLFITSTDVDGDAYTWIDDAGHAVDVKDHRAVFVLKHRPGRKAPFTPDDDTERALAKLARMTSCFPVAFEPVTVDATAPGPVDAKLVEWGKLDPRRRQFYLDGGVLDNKPFTYTLREIFYRMAHRKVERKLFYVDPDPERFENRVISEHAPSVPAAALKSLVSIPGYESIAEDLKLLSEHNDALSRFKRMTKAFDEKAAPELAKIDARLYKQARYLQLSERAVRGILRVDGRHALLDRERAEAAQRLYRAFDDWEDPADTLLDFDIYFRLRRVFDLIYRIDPPPPGDDPWPRGGLLWLLGRQVELLEIIQAGMERMLDNTPFAWKDRKPEEVWADAQAAFKILLDAPGLLPEGYARWEGESWLEQPALSGVNATLIARAGKIRETVAQGGALVPPAKFGSALVVTDACERDIVQAMSASNDPGLEELGNLVEIYEGFENVDAQMFPLQVFSGVHEKDIIRTARISPFDAQRGYSRRPGEEKISGDALHHFGGFLKRSWRSNDIMWGRMDGLCQLIEGLFTPLRLAEVAASPLGGGIAAKLANAEYLQEVFPAAPKKERDALAADLRRIFEEPVPYDKRPPEEVDKAFRDRFGFPGLLERLIRAGQHEILEEEVPRVLGDAVEQQAEWNQYRRSEEAKRASLVPGMPKLDVAKGALYRDGPGELDALVIAAASEVLARQAVDRSSGAAELLEKGDYTVGAEDVRTGVPPLVLMELAAKGLLALRQAVLGTIPEEIGKSLSKSTPNRWLGWFLKVFYGLVRFARRSPTGSRILAAVAGALSALALFVAFTWWTPVVHSAAGGISWWGAFFFVALPILVLGGLATRFAWRSRAKPGKVSGNFGDPPRTQQSPHGVPGTKKEE